jgi:hypothetical protein
MQATVPAAEAIFRLDKKSPHCTRCEADWRDSFPLPVERYDRFPFPLAVLIGGIPSWERLRETTMRINVRWRAARLSRVFVAMAATLLVLSAASSASAQCSGRGGGTGGGTMPPRTARQPGTGGASSAGINLAGLQQMAAMAQQARQQQLRQVAQRRQQMATLQVASTHVADRGAARPPRPDNYLQASKWRRAAYLRMRDQEAPETSSQVLTLAER